MKSRPFLNIDFFSAIKENEKGIISTVILYGKASAPGTFRWQPGQKGKWMSGGKIRTLNSKNVFPLKQIKTSASGHFSLKFRLPHGTGQIPLQFSSGERRKNILLSLAVTPKKIDLVNKKKKYDELKNHLWIGAGVNFLSFSQNFSEPIDAKLKFMSFAAPEFSLGFNRMLTDSWRVSLELRNSPGETTSNQEIQVTDGKYFWQAAVLDTIYLPNKNYPLKLFLGYKGRWQYRFGAQMQRVPFLIRTDSNSVEVKTNNLGFVTVGAGFQSISPSRKWTTDIFMRYQQNVWVADSYSASGMLAFEGLVGINRFFGDHWILGCQWNGQYIDLPYSSLDDFSSSSDISGNISLLHSLAELRIGYLW